MIDNILPRPAPLAQSTINLIAIKDLADPQPEDPGDDFEPVVESFDRIMAIIRSQEADLGGKYSESANEVLEWLAVELDHRLKTGFWSGDNEGVA